jgi:hypothetical protein
MNSISRRIILISLLALLALPVLQFAAPASTLAQTGEDAELLARYISQVQNETPAIGPESGTLSLEGGQNNTSSLAVGLTDQVIHVEFQAPQVDAGEVWAVAVAFRSAGDQYHFFLYWSDGGWSFAPAGGGNVQSGEAAAPGPAGTPVSIDIAAVGPDGYAGINGEYAATLDLSSQLGAGDVEISANLIGTFDPGDEPVSFSNFTVWSLEAGIPPADASPQAEASPAVEASPTTQPEPVASPEVEPAASPATEPVPAEVTASPQAEPAVPTTAAQPGASIQLDPSLDDEAQFNALLQTVTTQPIIFGPVNDTLEHAPDSVSFYPANVSVTDFAARVECIATISAADGFWDCGIAFRNTDNTDHYRVAYISDGYWFLSIGAGEPLMTGTDAPPSPSAGDKVTLNLIVIGAEGYFGINDQFVAKFDLSELPGPGSIDLASAFFNDTYIEGGGLQFEDFVIWSLDSATGVPVASPTQPAVVEPTPTEAATDLTPTVPADQSPVAGANVVGNTYTSPTYGYSLTWNDTWTVESDESGETGDYFGLSNGPVIADLIGEPWDPAGGSCFERLEQYYASQPAYSDIQSATDSESANPGIWEITGILTMTYTDEETGEATDYINYAACSEIPGQNAIVSLEQFVPVVDFRAQQAAMDELRAGFAPAGAVLADQTPTPGVEGSPTAVVEESPTAIAGQTSNVVGTTYTSPTFGYSLTWDETFEVLLDQSESGVDYLRISNETLTADLFAAAGDNTPEQCIDDLLRFYENDPLYSDVQFVTDAQDQPIRASGDGFATALISFTTTNDEGVEVTQYDNAICHRLEAQNAVVVFEVFTSPADSILQSAAVAELQNSLVLPGGTAPVESTPGIALTPATQPTVEDPAATVVPPPAEEVTTATFLLAPVGESDVQGTGTLEGQARLVTMTAIVIGAAPGDLVTIHRGSCADIGSAGEPDYIVGELDESGLMREDVQVRLTVLATADTYSVVIYGGDDDFSTPLACGEIGSR